MAYSFRKWLLTKGTVAGLLLTTPVAQAVTPPLDSMRTLLRQSGPADTTRVRLLWTLARQLRASAPDSALRHIE